MNRGRSIFALLLSAAIGAAAGCEGPRKLIDTWETRSPEVAVRVRQFQDYFIGDYIYVFEVQNQQSGEWRRLMKWVLDGSVPIQRQVKFVTDSIVYAFGHANYVVTTDGGKSWSEWDVTKSVPQGLAITDVVMSTDGTGSMRVRRSTAENNGVAEVTTSDFGVHWTLKAPAPPR